MSCIRAEVAGEAAEAEGPRQQAEADGDAWADDGGYGDDADRPTPARIPDVQPLLAQRLREALAEDWPGTQAELDAEVEALTRMTRDAGRRIRDARGGPDEDRR